MSRKNTTNRVAQNQAAQTRREQLRAQQQAAARRAQARMRIIYATCGVLVIAIIATVGVYFWDRKKKQDEAAAREATSQVKPPNLSADGSAIVANPKVTGDLPTLSIYIDFQCPACKQAYDVYGQTVNQLAESGKVKVEYKVLTFLDTKLKNDSSERAARASFCSDIQGKFGAFHDAVYANQPSEGTGFTDEQLRVTYPTAAGITGAALTSYQKCYDDKSTSKAVADEETQARKTWLGSTPQYSINGKNPTVKGSDGKDTEWWRVLQPTEDAWLQAIDANK